MHSITDVTHIERAYFGTGSRASKSVWLSRRALDASEHHHAVSPVARAFLVGFGVLVLLIVWNRLEAVAQGDPNPYEIDPRMVLALLGIVGSIVGWLWIVKIGEDAGKV
jgi:hypothetical protein